MTQYDEKWEDIHDYINIYQISSLGRIKSLERFDSMNRKNYEKILIPRIRNNYYAITLYKNNKQKTFSVHRLVAIHFIPNSENKPQVNHKDGNKLNNNVDNLEWCTRKENVQHAWKNGLCENVRKVASINGSVKGKKYGAINGKKYRSKKVYCIELNQEFESTREAERQLQIDRSGISKCCKGKLKSSGKKIINNKLTKLTWKYVS